MGDEAEAEAEEELMTAITESIGEMSISMSMDEGGRWRIARGQLKE